MVLFRAVLNAPEAFGIMLSIMARRVMIQFVNFV